MAIVSPSAYCKTMPLRMMDYIFSLLSNNCIWTFSMKIRLYGQCVFIQFEAIDEHACGKD